MIIYRCFNANYNNDPILNLRLEKYVNLLDDNHVLIIGLGHNHGAGKFPYYLHQDKNVINWYNEKKKIYYLDFEEGSSFYAPFLDRNCNLAPFENMCTKIFSICKLTSQFVNNHFNTNKRFAIPFFFSEDFIKTNFNKTIDVIYTGNYSSSKYVPINDIYETMKKFNYCWIGSVKSNYNAPTYENKIDMYAKSKIAVVHNILEETNTKSNFSFFKDKVSHFDYVDTLHIVPQIKSRTFEAAFNKCIILAFKDPFNTIEQFFEENVDFIYWTNKDELNTLLQEIINNYDKFKHIAEHAYNKAINNYTTKHFVENYLLNSK